MIAKIIKWSIANKFMVMLATVFLTFGGILAMVNTPLDAIPDLSDVQVIIFTEYPGQAPQVVEAVGVALACEQHIATLAAVAAVGPGKRLVLAPGKADQPVAALAGSSLDCDFIGKHGALS